MDLKSFNETIDKIRGNIGEDLSATNSEDFLALVGAFNELSTNYQDSKNEIDDLNKRNKELLETNGRLFQKIGFEKATFEEPTLNPNKENTKTIELSDLINEKGDLI